MRQKRIYIDTSVIGGCFDDEFFDFSNQLFNEFIEGSKIAIISDITLRELENAPKKVRSILDSIPLLHKEYLELSDESIFLAKKYIEEEAISPKFLLDAQHIAIATINKVDTLVSWNFKHIVNLKRIQLYNATNLKYGFPILEIRSPREVINEK